MTESAAGPETTPGGGDPQARVPQPDPDAGPDRPLGHEAASAAAPPSRRSAIIRSGLIVGVLVVVFGIILPRYVDYGEVVAAFQELTLAQLAVMSLLGIVAWIVSGAVFSALIPGLSLVRGTMSWLILGGIGASIPFGPWNMGVLWVVVRGWDIPNVAATSGIALYGVVNELSRLALPLIAVGIFALTGGLSGAAGAGTAWTIAIISIIAFVVAVAFIVAVVRSERVADWIGRTGQRIASWVMARLGRKEAPDVDGAIHRFRDQLGLVIRRRGAASLGIGVVSQMAWAIVLLVALRIMGIPESVLSPGEIFVVFSLVMVITIIPLSPGGAGVPELLFISAFTAIAGDQYNAAITAGVFLYRLYFWFLPIPLAWILLKVARRGKPMLPTAAELRAQAGGGS